MGDGVAFFTEVYAAGFEKRYVLVCHNVDNTIVKRRVKAMAHVYTMIRATNLMLAINLEVDSICQQG